MISFPWDNTSNEVMDRNIDSEIFRNFMYKLSGNQSGIFESLGTKGKVRATQGLNITVESLDGSLLGVLFYEENQTSLTLSSSSSLPRYDIVVARLDEVLRTVTIRVVEGTPATNPVKPSPTRTGDTYDIVLAEIQINALATEITDSQITDTRLDDEKCGTIPTINQVDTTSIFEQYQSALNEYLDLVQSAIDETTAGNLQSQITKNNQTLYLEVPLANWTDTAPYTNTITTGGAENYIDTDKPFVDVWYPDDTSDENQLEMQEQYNLVFRFDTIDGGLVAKCLGDAPTGVFWIMAKGV